MAIGTLAAIAIGAGALGSAALGSRASSKAVNAAKAGAADSTAVQREQLAAAQTALNPYSQGGIPASQALNSFLGLTPTQQPQQQPNALSQFGGGQTYGFEGMDGPQAGYHGSGYQPETMNSLNGAPFGFGNSAPVYGQAQGQQPTVSGPDAFRTFLNNSDYGFQFMEGADKLNSAYAGNGVLQSGAAVRGAKQFEQNLKAGYRGEFLNALGNQQGVGVTAGSALAGVGQNFANSISGINSNKSDAIGNAALTNASNISGLVGGIASAGLYGVGRR